VERTSWWDQILSIPAPRFLVIEDVDPFPGTGALIGEVHAKILRALGCVAAATNGAVRDVPEVDDLRFSMFAGSLSVSHAYAHIVEAGAPVQIGGLAVSPGDLLHADRHGIVSVPSDKIEEILNRAAAARKEDEELISICRSRNFSVEALRGAIRRLRVTNS
jgi:regulator of RNase E activity RraA